MIERMSLKGGILNRREEQIRVLYTLIAVVVFGIFLIVKIP